MISASTNNARPEKEQSQRVIDIAGTFNFRDLGGYCGHEGRLTRWQSLYRSAQLDRLDEAGIEALAKLDVKTVIDLRFPEETTLYPTMREGFPNARFYSWHDEVSISEQVEHSASRGPSWRESLASNDPAKVREAMRINYPLKLYSHSAIYRRLLLRLIDNKTPLIFHCAAGKDRTGVAAALILSLIGVDNEQIVNDYMLTKNQIGGREETWLAGGASKREKYTELQRQLAKQPREMLKPVFDADQSYIETLLDYVAATYGSFERYALKQLELEYPQLEQLRDNLLC